MNVIDNRVTGLLLW